MWAAGFGDRTETPYSSESLIMPLFLVSKERPVTFLRGTFQVQEEDVVIFSLFLNSGTHLVSDRLL